LGVDASLFDRQWSKLSGGESQRIVLVIVLSMQPDVLLLDESTSALDERMSILVDTTLKELHIPIVLVSQSGTQIDRFCNQRINLERTTCTTSLKQATIVTYSISWGKYKCCIIHFIQKISRFNMRCVHVLIQIQL
jgi:ABC-type dipeptide/oligopeptide/nickel transport system ATPase subunit